MNLERLNTLISFMRSLPKAADKHFNMGSWVNEKKKPEGACPVVGDKKRLMACGTKACALGWAGACKELQKQGLIVLAIDGDYVVEGSGINNTLLGKAFFDLDEQEFDDIFGGGNYDSTPSEWADRVEEYLRSYQ